VNFFFRLTPVWPVHLTTNGGRNIFNIVTFVTQDSHVVAIASKTMAVEHPFIIQDLTVYPSSEWSPHHHGWTVVRIAEGFGYCLCEKSTCELQVGDGFMAPQTASVIIRASQLVALRLHYFRIQPELLNGLMTVAECQHLKMLSNSSSSVFIFRADELSGQKFSRLVEQPRGEKLALRCALLQLWANGIAGLSGKLALNGSGERKLRERFLQLMEQLPEAELLGLSLADLAQQLHCSERHLGHLFRQKFGVPFRSHQIELRLQRACRLLADSRMKVANIACESGYQHLGLFNATFKRRFGMTPSEWRRRNMPNN
jgi:AraC-like DNA-binding protein